MQHVTAKAEHLPGGNARERESTLQVQTHFFTLKSKQYALGTTIWHAERTNFESQIHFFFLDFKIPPKHLKKTNLPSQYTPFAELNRELTVVIPSIHHLGFTLRGITTVFAQSKLKFF